MADNLSVGVQFLFIIEKCFGWSLYVYTHPTPDELNFNQLMQLFF